MDATDMQQLLQGYLNELNWAGGLTKDDLLVHLAGRDDTLRTMVNEYVSEGRYGGPGEIVTLIPVQAWQDAQGDEWRGPTTLDPEEVSSGYQDGPVGHANKGSRPTTSTSPAPGTDLAPAGTAATGRTTGIGSIGANAGEVDPGISGDSELTSESS
jgi:hypothetical protein